MMTDADEIPSREVVEALQWCDFPQTTAFQIISIPMSMYYYSLGCWASGPWTAPVAFTAGFFRAFRIEAGKSKHKKGTRIGKHNRGTNQT
jgi:hypothetical protein